MRTTLLTLLTIAGILAAATWTARLNSLPASAAATSPMHVIPPASADPIASPAPTRSPLAVAKALHTRRAAKDDLSKVAPFIAESRRAGTLQFLSAVDGVLAADAALHARVLQTHHVSLPESWNLRVIQDNLGLFSANVKFIGESINGSEATVTVQEGDNVPLIHARFVLKEGEWLHEPDAVESGVCDALDQLADVIKDVERSVTQGAPFESLADAFTFRILPRIIAVSRAGMAQGTDSN